MREETCIENIIINLFDEYPQLADEKNLKKLTWCVWAKMGYVDDYKINYRRFLSAPSVTSISRLRRKVVADYPPYISNLSKDKHARRRNNNRQQRDFQE